MTQDDDLGTRTELHLCLDWHGPCVVETSTNRAAILPWPDDAAVLCGAAADCIAYSAVPAAS